MAECFICMTYVSNTLQLKLPPTELDERVQANTCKKLLHYSVYVPVNAKVSPRWAVINCMIQRHSLFCGVDDTRQQALWHNSCRHICGWTWSYSGMWSWSFVAWLKEDEESKISDLRHTLMIVLTFCRGQRERETEMHARIHFQPKGLRSPLLCLPKSLAVPS